MPSSRLAALLALSLFAPSAARAAVLAPTGGDASPAAIDFALSPATIASDCKAELARASERIDAIVRVPAAAWSFSSVVVPLEDASADLNDRLVAASLASSVATERKVRDASLACQNDVGDFLTATSARPELYAAVAGAAKRGDATTDADRKLTALWLVALQRSGAGLPPEKRARFVTLGQQLSQLQNAFGNNLGNDATTIRISHAEARGLPADLVAGFKADGDGYVVRVDESTTVPFMQGASDPAVRKRYYLANANIAPENVALLQRAIAGRDELAHLLGYPTWAAYVLADRMAGTPARVTSFLAKLDARVLPRARADLARLAAIKAHDLGVASATIDPWDVAYYDERLRATTYAVDTNVVRRYFPVDRVERGVFSVYATLLGVTFAPRIPANAWNPDVTRWSVTDTASGRYIGDFFLDLYPRDGKYTHFASFPLLPARRLADGSMRPPLDAIIGNWPKPAPGHPALLTHDDVETFFHEFGHDMATMLARAPYETESAGFREDFVEAPSQMLENWVWDPQILTQLSSDVDTGAPLPPALIAKMRAARYVDDAYFTTRQIMLATIDMDYHTAGATVDTTAVWRSVAATTTPLALPPDVHPEASFGHLMGGYDAGYYGYLWSKVYAQDLFTAFASAGLEDPAVGARYRHDILEPARVIEPDAEVRAFLGRAMDPSAFYKEFDPVGPIGR